MSDWGIEYTRQAVRACFASVVLCLAGCGGSSPEIPDPVDAAADAQQSTDSGPVSRTGSYLLHFETADSCADAIEKAWTVRIEESENSLEFDTPSTTVIIPMSQIESDAELPVLTFPEGWDLGFSCVRDGDEFSCPGDANLVMIAQVVSTGMLLSFDHSLQLLGQIEMTWSGMSATGTLSGHVGQVVESALTTDCEATDHSLSLAPCTEPEGGGPCEGEILGTLP